MEFIFEKYGKDFLYNDVKAPNNMSLMFSDIWKCKSNDRMKNLITNNMFKWNIGDGPYVNFWKDIWYGDCSLSTSFWRLYTLTIRKDIGVAEMVSSWKEQPHFLWRRDPRGWEIESCSSLEQMMIRDISLSSKKDSISWLVSNGTWSTKVLYNAIDHTGVRTGPWQLIWKVKVPNRIKMFL